MIFRPPRSCVWGVSAEAVKTGIWPVSIVGAAGAVAWQPAAADRAAHASVRRTARRDKDGMGRGDTGHGGSSTCGTRGPHLHGRLVVAAVSADPRAFTRGCVSHAWRDGQKNVRRAGTDRHERRARITRP